MNIDEKVLIHWNSIRDSTDVAMLAAANDLSKVLFFKALQTGKCSRRVYEILRKYYAKKQRNIDYVISKAEFINE